MVWSGSFFAEAPGRKERAAIIAEVERLQGRIRNRTGRCAITWARFCKQPASSLPTVAIGHRSSNETGYEIPIAVRLAIGSMLQDAKPVPGKWMLSWLMTHPERRLRTPAVRAFPEFKALF